MRFTVFALAALLVGCESLDPSIAAAQKNVRDHQKDPDATQFRFVANCPNGHLVSGEVLGKNSYGAYTGWKRFWANEFEITIEGDDSAEDVSRQVASCAMSPAQWEADLDAALNGSSASADNLDSGLNGTAP